MIIIGNIFFLNRRYTYDTFYLMAQVGKAESVRLSASHHWLDFTYHKVGNSRMVAKLGQSSYCLSQRRIRSVLSYCLSSTLIFQTT